MNERLLQFLGAENISQSQFAETIGVARASVSHIIAGRNNPGYDFICSVFEHYPSLNPEWLLLGKGKMYKGSSAAIREQVAADVEIVDYHAQTPEAAPLAEPEPVPVQPVPEQETVQAPELPRTAQAFQTPLPGQDAGDRYHEPRTISRIIVFYSDNTFQELHG